jgi:hypothetical protein
MALLRGAECANDCNDHDEDTTTCDDVWSGDDCRGIGGDCKNIGGVRRWKYYGKGATIKTCKGAADPAQNTGKCNKDLLLHCMDQYAATGQNVVSGKDCEKPAGEQLNQCVTKANASCVQCTFAATGEQINKPTQACEVP